MGKKMTSWFQQMLSPTLLLSSPRSCFSSLSPFFFRRFTAARSAAAAAAALSPNNIHSHSHSHSQSHSLVQTLTPVQKDQISLYVGALLQWNQRMNLTAVTEESGVMTRHVADSLALIPPIITSYLSHCRRQSTPVGDGDDDDDVALNLNLVDVGSGAGLPGLIFAISCPSWNVTLLESMQKRCLFLEHVVDLIGLPNVEIVRERAENAGQCLDFRESFDVAVARAVAEMRILAEYCLPLVRVGGLFVAAKGYDPQEEVRSAEKAINLLGASILELCSVESQGPLGQRTAVICLKDCTTPKKYPRHPGIPAKTPL